MNHLGWRTGKADPGGPKEASSTIRVQVTVPSTGVEILTVLLVLWQMDLAEHARPRALLFLLLFFLLWHLIPTDAAEARVLGVRLGIRLSIAPITEKRNMSSLKLGHHPLADQSHSWCYQGISPPHLPWTLKWLVPDCSTGPWEKNDPVQKPTGQLQAHTNLKEETPSLLNGTLPAYMTINTLRLSFPYQLQFQSATQPMSQQSCSFYLLDPLHSTPTLRALAESSVVSGPRHCGAILTPLVLLSNDFTLLPECLSFFVCLFILNFTSKKPHKECTFISSKNYWIYNKKKNERKKITGNCTTQK